MTVTHMIRAALSGAALLALALSCTSHNGRATDSWPRTASVPFDTAAVGMQAAVRLGGYGSDLAFSSKDSTFWLLTDRGPNVDGPQPDSKVFPLPDFVPHIGVFRYEDGSLRLLRKIPLCDGQG